MVFVLHKHLSNAFYNRCALLMMSYRGEPECTSLTAPFLADFAMYWLSRPRLLERQGLPEKLSVLLMNLFYGLARAPRQCRLAVEPI